jgi:hypothetical protein
MKMIDGLVVFFVFTGTAAACDCDSYPFTPNPPCYSQCAQEIVTNKGKDIDSIQSLPADVRDDLKILVDKAAINKSIDFGKIQGRKGLDNASKIGGIRLNSMEKLEFQQNRGIQSN